MDMSNKSSRRERGPSEELFDLTVKYVALWSTAAFIGAGTNHLLGEVLPRGWRMGISLLAAYLFVFTFMRSRNKRPDFANAFLAWRYPIAMLLTAYVGYQWHAHDYGRSREARLNEAARWACGKNIACHKAAEDYLFDN